MHHLLMLPLVLGWLLSISLPPPPGSYVTDRAGIMHPARAAALNEKLAAFERSTSNQIIVYVDRRLPENTSLEEMSAEAIRSWGVGQKGRDNGVILFLFTGDRKLRIEVGYGLEGAIPDATAKRITSTVMVPLLKANDYAGAVEAGAGALMAAARGEGFRGTGSTVAETRRASNVSPAPRSLPTALIILMVVLGIGLLIVVMVWLARRKHGIGSDWGTSAGGFSGTTFGGPSSFGASSSSSSDSGSSFSFDGSGSSSDFSGGGGSGGGGGSSDSW